MTARPFEICIDANDPAALRPFWRTALGYVDLRTDEGAVDLADPDGVSPTVWFQTVPEPKASKNRLHLDIHVHEADHGKLVESLISLGGAVLAIHPGFTTLSDPEGNELCVNVR